MFLHQRRQFFLMLQDIHMNWSNIAVLVRQLFQLFLHDRCCFKSKAHQLLPKDEGKSKALPCIMMICIYLLLSKEKQLHGLLPSLTVEEKSGIKHLTSPKGLSFIINCQCRVIAVITQEQESTKNLRSKETLSAKLYNKKSCNQLATLLFYLKLTKTWIAVFLSAD